MIKSGVKKEEYRELKEYWVKRLVDKIEPYHTENCPNGIGFNIGFKQYSIIEFKNGYAKDAPKMRVEFKGIRIGKPKIEWCISDTKIEWCIGVTGFDQDNGSQGDCFIIELGSVLT